MRARVQQRVVNINLTFHYAISGAAPARVRARLSRPKAGFRPDAVRARMWRHTVDIWCAQVTEQTAVRARIRQHMVDMLGDDGVLAVPSAASVALPMGMDGPGLDECRQRAITIMSVAGLAGLPQVIRSAILELTQAVCSNAMCGSLLQ